MYRLCQYGADGELSRAPLLLDWSWSTQLRVAIEFVEDEFVRCMRTVPDVGSCA